MTHTSVVRERSAFQAMPQRAIVQLDKHAGTSSGFTSLLERATQETLAVTYWFHPLPHPQLYPVTIRFSGRRVDVEGRLSAGDRFVHDEMIVNILAGSGPISVTARVCDIHPGLWAVTAHVLSSSHPVYRLEEQPGLTGLITRFWCWWAPSADSASPISTCLSPFVRVPGTIPAAWGVMVVLGMSIALMLQSLVIANEQLTSGPVWMISLLAILIGAVGAKTWFIILHRHEHRLEGWCIQGFITGAIGASAILLILFHMPVGTFLDITAPGLLVAMAVGRVGCFFAGCCGGPPTASRWGVWSSDQRVGARRIPTQLLELALALSLGLGVLAAVLGYGPSGGAFFVAGFAAYTLGRQGILRLRAEPRKTRLGGLATSALATFLLIAAIVEHVR